MGLDGLPIIFFSILPDKKDCLPAITAFLKALAISNGFFAFAIAVLTRTLSQPHSIAIVASDATIAMELGCDGVLINTAIAKARKPYEMAEAMKFAVISGRKSFLSGRINKSIYANASTTNKGII